MTVATKSQIVRVPVTFVTVISVVFVVDGSLQEEEKSSSPLPSSGSIRLGVFPAEENPERINIVGAN